MKYSLLILVVAFISCKQTAIEQKLSGTDSVLVQFFDENGMIYNAVTSTEHSAISKLASFMEGKQLTAAECSPNGKVRFFAKKLLLLEATYHSTTNDCRYFSMDIDGKPHYVAMSNAAADFLRELTPLKFSD